MLELDLLCKLDKHYNSLDRFNKELKDLLQNITIDEIQIKIEENENQLEDLNKRKNNGKLALRKTEQKLKGYNYKIKEVDTKLYSGESKDISQLEKWSIEKEDVIKLINETETQVLELMEEIENITEELTVLKNLLANIKDEYKNQLINYNKVKNDLNNNIETEKNDINNLEKKIDEKILNQYKLIRKNKQPAVAEIRNNICSGCNITISRFVLESMKKDREIVCCELCGRILCKQ